MSARARKRTAKATGRAKRTEKVPSYNAVDDVDDDAADEILSIQKRFRFDFGDITLEDGTKLTKLEIIYLMEAVIGLRGPWRFFLRQAITMAKEGAALTCEKRPALGSA